MKYNVNKVEVKKMAKKLEKSPEMLKILINQAEEIVSQLPQPKRYTIVIKKNNKGVKYVEIQDNNKDALFYESQTGALSSIGKMKR